MLAGQLNSDLEFGSDPGHHHKQITNIKLMNNFRKKKKNTPSQYIKANDVMINQLTLASSVKKMQHDNMTMFHWNKSADHHNVSWQLA